MPPVAASRQYRGLPLAGRSPQQSQQLAVPHEPMWQRSNSESNLVTEPPRPLRRQGSSQSLRDPSPLADGRNAGRTMSLKDNVSLASMRATLFDDRNPYAPQPQHHSQPHSQTHSRAHSRRSSIASTHSYTGSTRADPRQQRNHILSQESLALTAVDQHHQHQQQTADVLPQSQPAGVKRIASRTTLHQELRAYHL